MKIATIVARVLLGLVFFVFGLAVFFPHLIPMPPPPKGEAGAFMGALFSSGYLYAIKCFEVAGGFLLLIGKKVPLGLTLVGPVLVNIMFYDIFLDHTGLPIGIIVAALFLFLLWANRKAFAGLLT
jgi:putative oxidoreductase